MIVTFWRSGDEGESWDPHDHSGHLFCIFFDLNQDDKNSLAFQGVPGPEKPWKLAEQAVLRSCGAAVFYHYRRLKLNVPYAQPST